MSSGRTVYIGLGELAARWGVHDRTIRRWIRRGEIPETGIPFVWTRLGRRYAWSEAQITELEEAMRERGYDPSPLTAKQAG